MEESFRTADSMTRKDSEKDSERPHYYSQFWLDVASGRHVIGAPKEAAEAETQEPATRKSDKISHESADLTTDSANGFGHTDIQEVETEEEPEAQEDEDEEEYADEEYQEPVEDEDIPDMDLGAEEDEEIEGSEEDEEDFFDEEEEEEEDEEDIGWGGRGRKKPKPGRQARPTPRKPGPGSTGGKRDTRRGY